MQYERNLKGVDFFLLCHEEGKLTDGTIDVNRFLDTPRKNDVSYSGFHFFASLHENKRSILGPFYKLYICCIDSSKKSDQRILAGCICHVTDHL